MGRGKSEAIKFVKARAPSPTREARMLPRMRTDFRQKHQIPRHGESVRWRTSKLQGSSKLQTGSANSVVSVVKFVFLILMFSSPNPSTATTLLPRRDPSPTVSQLSPTSWCSSVLIRGCRGNRLEARRPGQAGKPIFHLRRARSEPDWQYSHPTKEICVNQRNLRKEKPFLISRHGESVRVADLVS